MATSTDLIGSFICRKSPTWDQRLYFASEGRHAEDIFALKNPTASAGFESKASMQLLDHRSRLVFDLEGNVTKTSYFSLPWFLAEERTQQPTRQNPYLCSAHPVCTRSWGKCENVAFLLMSLRRAKKQSVYYTFSIAAPIYTASYTSKFEYWLATLCETQNMFQHFPMV
jgi:hypothetical protein